MSIIHKNSKLENVLVTVVTPVYNQKSTLKETIFSVLSQSYLHIEYIVINDGSTDGVEDVLSEFKGKIRIISQDNSGQAAALNRAWSEASGDYLCYVSADDILYPNCIETLVKSIDGQALVYYPDYDLIDVNSTIIRTVRTPDFSREDLVCKLICQPGLAAIFSADVFRQIGGWNIDYRFIPDFEFWVRMSSFGKFKRVPKVLGAFRIHNESGSVREISSTASDEIIRFVEGFSMFPANYCKQMAIFRAHLMSSRSHFQSRRIYIGIKRFYKAFLTRPIEAIQIQNLRFVLSGIFRRFYYIIKSKLACGARAIIE